MTDDPDRQRMLAAALNHLHAAIELLDEADAPGQIAAQLDLARHQLEGHLGSAAGMSRPAGGTQSSIGPAS